MPYISVGDGHKLYYELHGATTGKPCVVLHGGPGGGCEQTVLKFFDLQRWRILLFDQRGCGKSRPYGELRANTTWHLVEDIEILRKTVMMTEQWTVFGGSWGSTLALAYATRYPRCISAMILRGIYLGESWENDWMYTPWGAARMRPQEWQAFEKGSGGKCRTTRSCLKNYRDRLLAKNRKTRKAAVRAWNAWESSLSRLESQTSRESSWPLALLENHYFQHNCWLKPGQLLHAAQKMTFPVHIIQGR